MYDRETHDRLCAAAFKWTSDYATKFPATLAVDAGAAAEAAVTDGVAETADGPAAAVPAIVPVQVNVQLPALAPKATKQRLPISIPGIYTASLTETTKRKVFGLSVPWHTSMQLGSTLKFTEISDGLPDITFKLSTDAAGMGKATNISFSLPFAFPSASVALSGLKLVKFAPKKKKTRDAPAPDPPPFKKRVVQPKKKTEKTSPLPVDFVSVDYTIQVEAPATVPIGAFIAHRWNDFEGGWCVGKILQPTTGKKYMGQYEVLSPPHTLTFTPMYG